MDLETDDRSLPFFDCIIVALLFFRERSKYEILPIIFKESNDFYYAVY